MHNLPSRTSESESRCASSAVSALQGIVPRGSEYGNALCASCHMKILPVVGFGCSFVASAADAPAKKRTCEAGENTAKCASISSSLPNQPPYKKPSGERQHARVALTATALPQAEFPLGNSACSHASESLEHRSGRDNRGRTLGCSVRGFTSPVGSNNRLGPFVVALHHQQMIRPGTNRQRTGLDCLAEHTCMCLELPPDPRSRSRRTSTVRTRCHVPSDHAPGHQLNAVTRTSAQQSGALWAPGG